MSRPRRNDPRDLAPETLLPAIRSWLRPELPGLGLDPAIREGLDSYHAALDRGLSEEDACKVADAVVQISLEVL